MALPDYIKLAEGTIVTPTITLASLGNNLARQGTKVDFGAKRAKVWKAKFRIAMATAGTSIETRYKSASTAECPGDSVQVVTDVVASLGSARVSLVSPLRPDGRTFEVRPGDDYYVADRAVWRWTDDDNTWPDLAGATATLLLNHGSISIDCSIPVRTGTGKQIYAEMSRETSTQVRGQSFELFVTLANGHKVTLRDGPVVLT